MVKGVSRELRGEIRKVLQEPVNENPGRIRSIRQGVDRLKYEAVNYLADVGAFEQRGSGMFRLTAQGREHWDQMNAPRWYWFRRNWFAASVAGATIVAASVSAGANIANLVV